MAQLRLAALLLVSSTAAAAPTPIVTPPAGWVSDPEQAKEISKNGDAAVEVFVPHSPGVALIASRFSGPATGDEARRALDEMYGAADRAKIITPSAQIVERADHYDADRKELVATQTVKSDTTTVARLVIALDATHATAALGECVIRDDAQPALVEQCKAALVSLDPAVTARVAFALPTTATTIEAPTVAQPSMSDGTKYQMPPIKVEQDQPSTDRRPIYVGAGLVVLAAIFWFNRRQRDKFGKDDANG